MWDLRKSNDHLGPCEIVKYSNHNEFAGYRNMILHPQSNYLYASGTNDIVYCYLLDSTAKGM